MADEEVLNPSLYLRLRRLFGRVKVVNPREEAVYRVVRDSSRGGFRMIFDQVGEEYRVNCPFCGDRRSRLHVHHLYGQRDPLGRHLKFLAMCWNETSCMSRYDNCEVLYDHLTEIDGALDRVKVFKGVRAPEEARTAQLPGPCVPLHKLAKGHKARAYLESRRFDPDRLSRLWGVAYCLDSHYFLARDRIVIPILQGGELRGWQARYVGELPWKEKKKRRLTALPPKYFTCPNMPRRLLLYNFDRAVRYQTGVVVEGVTDVWSFGGMAMCTFGSHMTAQQFTKCVNAFRRRSLCLLFDPDAREVPVIQRLVERFQAAMPGAFAAVWLPRGTDPGSLDRDFLREFVAGEAAEQGVKVSWKRVKE